VGRNGGGGSIDPLILTWPQSKMNLIKSKTSAWVMTTRSEGTYDDELMILEVLQSLILWDNRILS